MAKTYNTRQEARNQQAMSRNSDSDPNLDQTFIELHTSMSDLRNLGAKNTVRDRTMSNPDTADNLNNVDRVSDFISQQISREIISLENRLLVRLNESIRKILTTTLSYRFSDQVVPPES